jgi:hypothetical protein
VSEDRQPESETGAPSGSVFGNLPDSRPGTRSPRREQSAAAGKRPSPARPKAARAAASRAKGAAKPKHPAKPKPASKAAGRTGTAAKPRAPEPAAEPTAGRGLEDVAWAGVAAAAEAATIGVRLASRAIEALRGNAERE